MQSSFIFKILSVTYHRYHHQQHLKLHTLLLRRKVGHTCYAKKKNQQLRSHFNTQFGFDFFKLFSKEHSISLALLKCFEPLAEINLDTFNFINLDSWFKCVSVTFKCCNLHLISSVPIPHYQSTFVWFENLKKKELRLTFLHIRLWCCLFLLFPRQLTLQLMHIWKHLQYMSRIHSHWL